MSIIIRVARVSASIAIAAAIFAASPLNAASLSSGQRRGGGGGGGGGMQGQGQQGQQTQAQQQAQQQQQQAAQIRAAAIAAAQTDVSAASTGLNAVVKKLTAEFQASPDLKAAQDIVTAANDAYEKAKAPVLAALPANSTAYQTAKAKEATLQAKYDAAKKSGSNSSTMATIGQSLYDIGNTTGPMEQAAFAKDPDCKDAKKKLDDAVAAVTKMTADFKASIKTNADWLAAKSTLDAAQASLAAAQGNTPPGQPPAAPPVVTAAPVGGFSQ